MKKWMICFAVMFIFTMTAATGVKSTEKEPISREELEVKTQAEIVVNGKKFTAAIFENAAAEKLMEGMPMKVNMREFGGTEKQAHLPESFRAEPEKVGRVQAGDLALLKSDCLVLFYEDFETPYQYTRIGYIENPQGLKETLGNGNAELEIRPHQ